MERKFTIHEWRVSRLASKIAMQAAARCWHQAPWAPAFQVHHEVPHPGCPDGCTLDPATGYLLGWDGRLAAYFEHDDGRPAGVIYAIDWERRVFAPGALGFTEWHQEVGEDAVGVMLAPRALV